MSTSPADRTKKDARDPAAFFPDLLLHLSQAEAVCRDAMEASGNGVQAIALRAIVERIGAQIEIVESIKAGFIPYP